MHISFHKRPILCTFQRSRLWVIANGKLVGRNLIHTEKILNPIEELCNVAIKQNFSANCLFQCPSKVQSAAQHLAQYMQTNSSSLSVCNEDDKIEMLIKLVVDPKMLLNIIPQGKLNSDPMLLLVAAQMYPECLAHCGYIDEKVLLQFLAYYFKCCHISVFNELYSNAINTRNCNLLCLACAFGVKIRFPEAIDILKLCTLRQLMILESVCKDDSVSIILLFQLQYWIDHGEANIIPSFQSFNHHMCLTHNTKLLSIVMSLLEIYKAPNKKASIVETIQQKIHNFFQKEEPAPKSEAYYDTNLKCWVIRGVPSAEIYDMGEIESKDKVKETPSPMIKSPCEQQSKSFHQLRYLVQPFL